MESIRDMAIDEVSMNLGELKADLRALGKDWAVINNKLDKVLDAVAVINNKSDKAHDYIEDMREPLERADANGQDWADTKRKAKWIIGGMGLTGAFSSWSITKAFAAWWS